MIFRITHRERPERIVRRELSCREVHDVVLPAVERMTRAVTVRPPVHRFLRYVYRAEKYPRVRGSQEHAVAGLAASVHGNPAVDLRAFDAAVRLGRDKRQPEADEDPLHHIALHGSRTQIGKEEQADDEIPAYHADDCYEVPIESAHVVIILLLAQRHELYLLRKIIGSRQVAVAVHQHAGPYRVASHLFRERQKWRMTKYLVDYLNGEVSTRLP